MKIYCYIVSPTGQVLAAAASGSRGGAALAALDAFPESHLDELAALMRFRFISLV